MNLDESERLKINGGEVAKDERFGFEGRLYSGGYYFTAGACGVCGHDPQ